MSVAPIDARRVAAAVGTLGLDWEYREETGSTNADALAGFARDGRQRVVFAERQTAGRGRRGRAWHSPRGANLYCTVGLRKSLPPASQGLLSIVAGVALARALGRQCGTRIGLKWPNDLVAAGAKLGGILIESRADGGAGLYFAIGFGINLGLTDADLAAIGQPATSLERIAAARPERSATLLAAIAALVEAVRAFEVTDAGRLADEFRQLDPFHGRPVDVLRGGARIRGVSDGINTFGELRLRTANGIEHFAAGEISLREAGR